MMLLTNRLNPNSYAGIGHDKANVLGSSGQFANNIIYAMGPRPLGGGVEIGVRGDDGQRQVTNRGEGYLRVVSPWRRGGAPPL
jgi:hypothetical protein